MPKEIDELHLPAPQEEYFTTKCDRLDADRSRTKMVYQRHRWLDPGLDLTLAYPLLLREVNLSFLIEAPSRRSVSMHQVQHPAMHQK